MPSTAMCVKHCLFDCGDPYEVKGLYKEFVAEAAVDAGFDGSLRFVGSSKPRRNIRQVPSSLI